MDFALSEEQTALRSVTRAFAAKELQCRPGEPTDFSWNGWRRCAAQGYLGLLIPEEYGGAGVDCLTAALTLDALGEGATDDGLIHALSTQIISGQMIVLFGTEEQKARHLPAVTRGEIVLAQAITEPEAGSDTGSLRTRAVADGAGFRITGTKVFTSNGPIADLVLVFAVTAPDRPQLGRTSCFLVDKDTPGFGRGPPMAKMGLSSLQNGCLHFDDSPVGAGAVLGPIGAGSTIFGEAMTWERILLFASQVGKLQRLTTLAVRYAKERRQFDRPVGQFQAVAHKIADMRVAQELARLMVYKAAWLKAKGKSAMLEASMAKLVVSESVRSAALDLVQIHGGYGYMKETGIERELRDSMGLTIYSGTSEIQRNIIARLCGL